MTKRHLHLVRPMDPKDPRDKELHAIFHEVRETEVSAMHPLELSVPCDMLIDLIEDSIQALRAKDVPHPDDLTRDYTAAIIQQRVEFLDQLRNSRDEEILVALYPAAPPPEELRELELELGDLSIDEDDDLPI